MKQGYAKGDGERGISPRGGKGICGRETLTLVPGGITSLKNCLNFSARLALPCEGGKARATASRTAPTVGALAANLCRRSANMAGSLWKRSLVVHTEHAQAPKYCHISKHVDDSDIHTRLRHNNARLNDAQLRHAGFKKNATMLDPHQDQLQ